MYTNKKVNSMYINNLPFQSLYLLTRLTTLYIKRVLINIYRFVYSLTSYSEQKIVN